MRQTVVVTKTMGTCATVIYDRPTACHGDCNQCAGGCGCMAAKEQVTVCAENLIGAKPGDRVVMETATRQIYGAVFLVYVLPVTLFFLGYGLGCWLLDRGTLTGIGGFMLGIAAAVVLSQWNLRLGRAIRYRIVSYAK